MVIRKGIPVAGGMAGGSADAAATLVGLAGLWRLEIGRDELAGLAAKLGSDVPFVLHGGVALGTGRGEQLVPVLSRHTFHWVLAFDRRGLATPKVYAELDRLREEGEPRGVGAVEPVIEALSSGDPRQLALLLGNDLQPAAVSLRPGLRRTLRAGVQAGALAGTVSGSGPTCAFLCESGEDALRVAAELAGAGVCRTVRVAHGPVPGARVVNDEAPRPDPARGPRLTLCAPSAGSTDGSRGVTSSPSRTMIVIGPNAVPCVITRPVGPVRFHTQPVRTPAAGPAVA